MSENWSNPTYIAQCIIERASVDSLDLITISLNDLESLALKTLPSLQALTDTLHRKNILDALRWALIEHRYKGAA